MYNEFIDKYLNDMLAGYADYHKKLTPGQEIELEMRYKNINAEVFEDLHSNILKDKRFINHRLECSINIISSNVYERNKDTTQYVRKMLFSNGEFAADSYYTKLSVIKPLTIKDYIDYNIRLSLETPSTKFPTKPNAHIRVKIRFSADYAAAKSSTYKAKSSTDKTSPKWRFDLTAVKSGTLKDLGPSLKEIKQNIFKKELSPDNFAKLLREYIDSYEIEIEYIGADIPVIDDFQVSKQLFAMINPNYLKELVTVDEIYHIAQYISSPARLSMFKQGHYRLKQLLNAVIALNKNTYQEIWPPINHYVTDKADGKRAVISINGNRCRILMSDGLIEHMTDPTFTPGDIIIADAELIEGQGLYVFDVMVFKNDNVSKLEFSQRLALLGDVVAAVRPMLPEGMAVSHKEYVQITENIEAAFRAVYEKKYPYTLDGIIIVEPGRIYTETKNYKWKPLEYMTVDFLAIKCPADMLGIKPYNPMRGKDLYLLFVGIDNQAREKLGLGLLAKYKQILPSVPARYYPVQFSPSSSPLAYLYYHDKSLEDCDRRIIELSLPDDTDVGDVPLKWIFHKIRTDRQFEKEYFGNDFKTAELTFINYVDPFVFEDLFKEPTSYFRKNASSIYDAPNKFKRFVISMLFKNNLSGSKWVIDEAAGRGADLQRYQEIGVENALFMDIDATAISELISRKFAIFANKKRFAKTWFADSQNKRGGAAELTTQYDRIQGIEYDKIIVRDHKSMTVHTLVMDLKTPRGEIIASTMQYGLNPGIVDAIVCNFAIHYLCDTIENLRNVLHFNADMLKPGGLFIFTTMDGEAIFKLLSGLSSGQRWESRENDVVKYAIVKKYQGNTLSQTSQMISIKLPFTDEYMDEPLCNIDLVISEAKKLGFSLELNDSMLTYYNKFAAVNRGLADKLTEEDKKYIGLHKYVSLRLVKKK